MGSKGRFEVYIVVRLREEKHDLQYLNLLRFFILTGWRKVDNGRTGGGGGGVRISQFATVSSEAQRSQDNVQILADDHKAFNNRSSRNYRVTPKYLSFGTRGGFVRVIPLS